MNSFTMFSIQPTLTTTISSSRSTKSPTKISAFPIIIQPNSISNYYFSTTQPIDQHSPNIKYDYIICPKRQLISFNFSIPSPFEDLPYLYLLLLSTVNDKINVRSYIVTPFPIPCTIKSPSFSPIP